MADTFIVTVKKQKKKMSIKISRELKQKFDELACKTNCSRNELMCLALSYSLKHPEIYQQNMGEYTDEKGEDSCKAAESTRRGFANDVE